MVPPTVNAPGMETCPACDMLSLFCNVVPSVTSMVNAEAVAESEAYVDEDGPIVNAYGDAPVMDTVPKNDAAPVSPRLPPMVKLPVALMAEVEIVPGMDALDANVAFPALSSTNLSCSVLEESKYF